MPKRVTDEDLRLSAEARTLSRFPVAVWYCREKGTVMMRSSQPRVGFFSYRYEKDELLIEHVSGLTSKGTLYNGFLCKLRLFFLLLILFVTHN